MIFKIPRYGCGDGKEGTERQSVCSPMATTTTRWTCGVSAVSSLKLSAYFPSFQVPYPCHTLHIYISM